MRAVGNIVAMQAAWFGCVLGAAHGVAWVGTTLSLFAAALHLALADQPKSEGTLLLWAVAIGMVLDSALASAGYIDFASDVWIEGFTTHWMLGLWIGFATTLTTSLRWLMQRPLAALAFGAVGGPLAYATGARLGALTLTSDASLFAISFAWILAMAMFTFLTRRSHLALSQALPV